MSHCPGEATLRLLGTDLVGDATYESIEQHVEGCADCKGVVEQLAHRHADPKTVSTEPYRFPNIPGFEIVSELGHGAMGVVYRAIETGLDRSVALKILPGAIGSDASSDRRRHWLREARAVSRVRHPNVVTLYDYGEADGCFFLVLQYVPGGSLKNRLAEPLPPRVAAGLMETIVHAVSCIHRNGLFHLDLKPSNILLDGAPNAAWETVVPRVADFGLAVSDGHHDVSETSLAFPRGTPFYMSPEQARANRAQIGAASDIHALGALLYELVTGRPPFQGASPLETLDQVRSQNPVPPRRLNPKIPRDLETIALKCLEKNPSRRYAFWRTCTLAGDLRRCLDGKPISARPVSAIEHAWRWCRRRPAVAALAASLLMTISVGFLAIVMVWRRAEVERNRAEQERSVAERERSRAEAGYKTARTALAEVLDLGTTGIHAPGLTKDQFIARLQTTRRRILDLAEPRSGDLEISKLAYVDLVLGREFDAQGKTDDARLLNDESLSFWDNLVRKDPSDKFAQHRRFENALRLARTSAEDSLRHWERASLFGESILPGMSIGELGAFAECRCSVATRIDDLGDHDRARAILEETLRIVGDVPARNMTPDLCARVAMTQFELGKITQQFSLREIDNLTPEDWADRVARFVSSIFATDSMRPLKESEVACWLTHLLGQDAAVLRRTAKLDRARQTVGRIHSLGKIMVARHPDQAAAHLALCETFSQLAKNAWRFDDRGDVERNWALALDEARRALRLDPQDTRASRDVFTYQRRLDDLRAPL